MHIVYRVIKLAEYDDYDEIENREELSFATEEDANKYIEFMKTRDSIERFSVDLLTYLKSALFGYSRLEV